jgi:hypothetical protein
MHHHPSKHVGGALRESHHAGSKSSLGAADMSIEAKPYWQTTGTLQKGYLIIRIYSVGLEACL